MSIVQVGYSVLLGAPGATSGAVAGACLAYPVGGLAWYGCKMTIGNDFRFAPFGNRTDHPFGRWPRYHRRGPIDPETGTSDPGQGIGRHRPWDTRKDDQGFLDRF
jgi:hypothetical protein